jgi:hypothetical protein
MAKRGRVLRDPRLGPGLLMVEGRQYPFLMEGLWRSEVPARPGLVVNVDFDAHGNLNAITAVPECQVDSKVAARAKASVRPFFEHSAPGSASLVRLTGVAAILLCWLFLSGVSIHQPFFGTLDLTFWQILGALNTGSLTALSDVAGTPDAGAFGLLAVLVLAGPFFPLVWKPRWASLGGMLPLSFIVLVAYWTGGSIQASLAPQTAASWGSSQTPSTGILHAVSIGFGTYLSASVAIYFAISSVRQFVVTSRSRKSRLEQSRMAA